MEVDIKLDDDLIEDLNYMLKKITTLTVNKFVLLYKKKYAKEKNIDILELSQNIILYLFEKYDLT